jgi:hypothetical protein
MFVQIWDLKWDLETWSLIWCFFFSAHLSVFEILNEIFRPEALVSFSLCWACLFIFEILNEILRLKTLVSSFLSACVLCLLSPQHPNGHPPILFFWNVSFMSIVTSAHTFCFGMSILCPLSTLAS